jgi:two-component system, cell cycle sensor histidine kinase and response regulator CckA
MEENGPQHSTDGTAPSVREAALQWRPYLIALLAVAAASGVRASLTPFAAASDPALTIFSYLVAVGIAGTLRGVSSGIAALGFGAVAAWFLFLGQMYASILDTTLLVGIALYIQTGVGIAFLTGAQHRAHALAEAASRQAAVQAEQLKREVSARRRAEEARRQTEERYRTPADQVKDYALFVLDRHGCAASWNEGVERVLGYPKTEFLKASVRMLYTEEDRAAGVPERTLAEAVEQGEHTAERWLVRKGGKRIWVSEATSRIYGREGQVLGFAKRLRDLSGLWQVQDELRRNQEALQLAHDAAQLGTWDHDLVTGEIRWDSRAKALFGFAADAVVTEAVWQGAVHPDDVTATRERWNRALREQKPFAVEYRVPQPDGSTRWITTVGQASFDPVNGAPVRLMGVMLDFTERKEAEQRLQEMLRLEAIGRLAGGIAHDLNNMLVAILGYSDMLGRSLDQRDPRRRDVEQISEAAGRSAKLTRQLLAFARRELIQPQRLDLNAIVRRSEGMLPSVLGENSVLELKLTRDGGVIYADPAQVEQILMNLVLNARDAMPQGGRITIETSHLALSEASLALPPQVTSSGDRYVMLAVRDTGSGMDAATLQRMWEPFFTTKPAGKGTGLGLAAVYGAVKQSGGFVWADSELGRGTTVSVYWPAIPHAAEPLVGETSLPAPERGNELVLVVEDEPMVRALSVRTLSLLGYRCVEARDASEALAAIDAGLEPDLVITDVVMPEMSGAEFGERLALRRPALPVLYTSGFSDEDVIGRGLLRSGRPFLQKPFAPAELARKVREVLLNTSALRAGTPASG